MMIRLTPKKGHAIYLKKHKQISFLSPNRDEAQAKMILLKEKADTGIRFQVSFTPLLGVLFTFPSRYWFAIGRRVVFSLE